MLRLQRWFCPGSVWGWKISLEPTCTQHITLTFGELIRMLNINWLISFPICTSFLTCSHSLISHSPWDSYTYQLFQYLPRSCLICVSVNRAICQPLLPLTYVAFGHRSHHHPYPSPFAYLEQMTKRVSILCFVAATQPTSLSPRSGDWRMVSGVDGQVVWGCDWTITESI